MIMMSLEGRRRDGVGGNIETQLFPAKKRSVILTCVPNIYKILHHPLYNHITIAS